MSDTADDSWDEVRLYLDPFLRAADYYAAGNDTAGFAILQERINAEPITEDDDQLIRTWAMATLGALVAGAALRKRVDMPIPEDAWWGILPMTLDGTSMSLDETAPPDVATAIRMVIAGANKDFDMCSALLGATWDEYGPPGMLLVLSSLVDLYATMRPAEAPARTCQCGHPETAHDAGQCWTYPDATATNHPDPVCSCDWYEEARP